MPRDMRRRQHTPPPPAIHLLNFIRSSAYLFPPREKCYAYLPDSSLGKYKNYLNELAHSDKTSKPTLRKILDASERVFSSSSVYIYNVQHIVLTGGYLNAID